MIADDVVGEVWVRPFEDVGVKPGELAAFAALGRFQRLLIDTLGSAAGMALGAEPFDLFGRVDGFPILIRRVVAGRVESETLFEGIERVPSSPERFAVPAGYTRRRGPGGQPSTEVAPPPAPPSPSAASAQ